MESRNTESSLQAVARTKNPQRLCANDFGPIDCRYHDVHNQQLRPMQACLSHGTTAFAMSTARDKLTTPRGGSPPPLKKRKNGSQKCWGNTHEVHLEVTRLERHAIFRRSISLDDVDCFDTLKSQTYQWHEFITLLFQGLRGPFRVVLMRTSCQSRFLCDVIE